MDRPFYAKKRCLVQDEQGRWNKYGGRLPWDTRAICNNNLTFGGTGNHKVSCSLARMVT